MDNYSSDMMCEVAFGSVLLIKSDVCAPQVFQGVNSGDGPEARSGLPVRHLGPVHP